MTVQIELKTQEVAWVAVCRVTDLVPERGAGALLGLEQVARVRLIDDRVLAVQQYGPFSGANVISRGIVGSRSVDGRDVPTIASPMYKQVFALETGRCLDAVGKKPQDLRSWPVLVVDGIVHVAADGAEPRGAEPRGAEPQGASILSAS